MSATTTAPLRLVQVGAGGMGETWLGAVAADDDVELVGLVDLDLERARAALAALGAGLDAVPVAGSLDELLDDVAADAVLVVTTPEAHAEVSTAALRRGLAVLCEKPAAPDVATALVMAASAEATGQLLMIAQSKRYLRQLDALRGQAARLGQVGALSCTFFRGPRFGGFRESMADPLLADMAVHAFDTARLLLAREPLAVWCESWNPPWSWYAGDAVAEAVFEMAGGARFRYSGSWCARGEETSWAGRWHLEGADGSATWDGETAPVARAADGSSLPAEPGTGAEEVAGALADFVACLRTARTPDTAVAANVLSVAMVEAAVRSSRERRRVELEDVVRSAHRSALQRPLPDRVRAWLADWPRVREALHG